MLKNEKYLLVVVVILLVIAVWMSHCNKKQEYYEIIPTSLQPQLMTTTSSMNPINYVTSRPVENNSYVTSRPALISFSRPVISYDIARSKTVENNGERLFCFKVNDIDIVKENIKKDVQMLSDKYTNYFIDKYKNHFVTLDTHSFN